MSIYLYSAIITENSTYREYLKYHRLKEGLSYNALGNKIGYRASDLKLIETGNKEMTRDVSKRLSNYFKLDTIYFYNQYFEDTENISDKIRTYLEYNGMKLSELSRKIDVSYAICSQWKRGLTYPNKNDYLKLKEIYVL